MRAVGYVRVSTQEQTMHSLSLTAQRECLQKYADDHNMNLIRVYADEGISASKALQKRTGILELVKDAEEGKFDVILFKDLSRWSRSPSQFYAVQDRLDKCKVPWIAVEQQNLETMTASGRLIVGIHISVSAHESDQLGERIKFVNETRVQRKLAIAGSQYYPTGYKVDPDTKHVVFDEDKREIVEFIFGEYERTANTYKTVLAVKDRFGEHVGRQVIAKMIANPIYKGEYRGVKDFCPAYLTEERWTNIQNLSEKRSYRSPQNREYIFSGLCKCAECGHSMTSRYYDGRSYYACQRYQEKTCGHKRYIREDALEEFMLAQLDKHLKNIAVTAKTKPGKQKNVAQIKKKLERLTELYIEGDISKSAYQRRKEMLEKDLTETPEEQKTIQIDDWRAYYDKATKGQKNVAWKSIIKRITISKDNRIEVEFHRI